jgi:hypothetical protein
MPKRLDELLRSDFIVEPQKTYSTDLVRLLRVRGKAEGIEQRAKKAERIEQRAYGELQHDFFSHEPVPVSSPASVFSPVLFAPRALLFDHPIRSGQDVWWNP